MSEKNKKYPGSIISQMLDDLDMLREHFRGFKQSKPDRSDIEFFDHARLATRHIAEAMQSYMDGYHQAEVNGRK